MLRQLSGALIVEHSRVGYTSTAMCSEALLEGTGDVRERSVGVLAYKPDGANHNNKNRCQHHGIFRDILTLVLPPNPVQKSNHVPPHVDAISKIYRRFLYPQAVLSGVGDKQPGTGKRRRVACTHLGTYSK